MSIDSRNKVESRIVTANVGDGIMRLIAWLAKRFVISPGPNKVPTKPPLSVPEK